MDHRNWLVAIHNRRINTETIFAKENDFFVTIRLYIFVVKCLVVNLFLNLFNVRFLCVLTNLRKQAIQIYVVILKRFLFYFFAIWYQICNINTVLLDCVVFVLIINQFLQ